MKRYILLLWLLLFLSLTTRAEGGERVYLQTDKQVYISGERLWMKLFLTDAFGKPSALSKVGYIELADGYLAQVQVKVEINEGVGEGWMELPSRLTTGYYRLIAYTRAMENEGEAVYFNKTIGIVNTYRTDRSIPTDTAPAPIRLPIPQVSDGGLTATASKPAYHTREQGFVRLEGLPQDLHSLSVSIAGGEFIPVPEEMPLSRWKENLSLSNPREGGTDSSMPEYEGHIIRGRLLHAGTNEPWLDEVYTLAGFAGDDIRVFGGRIDKPGNVSFYTNRISGFRRLGLVAYSTRGGACRIELTSPFASHTLTTPPVFSINPAWEEQLLQRSIGVQALYSFTDDSAGRQEPPEPHFRWKPDVSYLLDEYTRFAGMQEMFIEFIPYLRFRMVDDERRLSVILNDFLPGNHSLALLDGIPVTDHHFLYNYDPRRLKRVDIYRTPFYFGGQMFDGIASFTSFHNDHPGLTSSPSLRLLDYEGTQLRRRFHAPSYTNGGEVPYKRIPDYRHTLLWAPEVHTGGQPSALIPFATSDFAGPFRVTVEGLTKDGHVVRAVTSFEVEGR